MNANSGKGQFVRILIRRKDGILEHYEKRIDEAQAFHDRRVRHLERDGPGVYRDKKNTMHTHISPPVRIAPKWHPSERYHRMASKEELERAAQIPGDPVPATAWSLTIHDDHPKLKATWIDRKGRRQMAYKMAHLRKTVGHRVDVVRGIGLMRKRMLAEIFSILNDEQVNKCRVACLKTTNTRP